LLIKCIRIILQSVFVSVVPTSVQTGRGADVMPLLQELYNVPIPFAKHPKKNYLKEGISNEKNVRRTRVGSPPY